MKLSTDIDIDFADRDEILNLVRCIPAAMVSNGATKKHTSGVYFNPIPIDPMTGISSIDYKIAEERGYFKIDFLNNSIYQGIENEKHLIKLINAEPLWWLLQEKDVVSQLSHIHAHLDVLQVLKPDSIEKLAATLAIIRPAKRHLLHKPWSQIMKEVWVKPEDDLYFFKKSHSTSYAIAVVVQLNLICEQAGLTVS